MEKDARIARLQKAFTSLATDHDEAMEAEYSFSEGIDTLADTHGLLPGDLAPMPEEMQS